MLLVSCDTCPPALVGHTQFFGSRCPLVYTTAKHVESLAAQEQAPGGEQSSLANADWPTFEDVGCCTVSCQLGTDTVRDHSTVSF